MIHSSESTCKNYCMLRGVTGVFADVSQVCSAMLRHCIVGVQKVWQMWRNINTSVVVNSPLTGWFPCSISESICGPHGSPAITMLIHVCYIFKTILSTSAVTNSDKVVQMCQFHVAKQLPDWRHFQENLWPNLHNIWVYHCHHHEKQQNCCIWIHIK
jgi:hypothetical protein